MAEPSRCGQDPQCRYHLEKGVAFDLAHKYDSALREFQAAFNRQADPRVAVNVGRTLHKLGRFAEALTWYKNAGRADPADVNLQKQLQEFIVQAKQNLPASPLAPVSVVNRPSFVVQTSPVNLTVAATARATAINNNYVKIGLGTLTHDDQPRYKRASFWIPMVCLVLTAGAVGIGTALWPHPYQPDPTIPWYPISATTAGGVR